ncbi:MAG: hypothetical protein ACRD15_04210, partial [Vicinamibacterales bacterium]
MGDANQVLFVSRGESYHLSQPLPGDYAELIITPDPDLLAELVSASESSLPFQALFRRRSRRADLRLQMLRARFQHGARHADWCEAAA